MKLPANLLSAFCVICSGCYLSSTFQSAETIEPATGRAGVSLSLIKNGPGLDLPSRIGIVRNFDIGIRYSYLDHILLDAKYQFLREPLDASISLGFSYNTVNIAPNRDAPVNKQVSKGFFPTILFGETAEDVGWYAGMRALYVSQKGTEEFPFSAHTPLFEDTGWIAKGFVVGGFIHAGSKIRFVNEINVLYGNKKTAVIPTIGFQFDMN